MTDYKYDLFLIKKLKLRFHGLKNLFKNKNYNKISIKILEECENIYRLLKSYEDKFKTITKYISTAIIIFGKYIKFKDKLKNWQIKISDNQLLFISDNYNYNENYFFENINYSIEFYNELLFLLLNDNNFSLSLLDIIILEIETSSIKGDKKRNEFLHTVTDSILKVVNENKSVKDDLTKKDKLSKKNKKELLSTIHKYIIKNEELSKQLDICKKNVEGINEYKLIENEKKGLEVKIKDIFDEFQNFKSFKENEILQLKDKFIDYKTIEIEKDELVQKNKQLLHKYEKYKSDNEKEKKNIYEELEENRLYSEQQISDLKLLIDTQQLNNEIKNIDLKSNKEIRKNINIDKHKRFYLKIKDLKNKNAKEFDSFFNEIKSKIENYEKVIKKQDNELTIKNVEIVQFNQILQEKNIEFENKINLIEEKLKNNDKSKRIEISQQNVFINQLRENIVDISQKRIIEVDQYKSRIKKKDYELIKKKEEIKKKIKEKNIECENKIKQIELTILSLKEEIESKKEQIKQFTQILKEKNIEFKNKIKQIEEKLEKKDNSTCREISKQKGTILRLEEDIIKKSKQIKHINLILKQKDNLKSLEISQQNVVIKQLREDIVKKREEIEDIKQERRIKFDEYQIAIKQKDNELKNEKKIIDTLKLQDNIKDHKISELNDTIKQLRDKINISPKNPNLDIKHNNSNQNNNSNNNNIIKENKKKIEKLQEIINKKDEECRRKLSSLLQQNIKKNINNKNINTNNMNKKEYNDKKSLYQNQIIPIEYLISYFY